MKEKTSGYCARNDVCKNGSAWRGEEEGTMNRKAVQIRQGWSRGESKRLDFCMRRVCLAVQVVLVLS